MGNSFDNRQQDRLAIAGFSFAVILFSLLSDASPFSVSLFGVQLPALCPFRLLTSFDCPACGLTRSLVLAFHGQFQESYLTNIFGIPLALIFLFQIPYQLFTAFSRKKFRDPSIASHPGFGYLILIVVLVPWTLKTVAVAFILWG